MPRFRPEILLTAFYLYRRDKSTGELRGPCGTGVFVARASGILDHPHVYAVTAHHVAVSGGASIIRLNSRDPTAPIGARLNARFLHYEPYEWQFIPGGDDIAAVDLTGKIGDQYDFVRAADEKDFVTIEFMNNVKLGAGDDGFMLGLFSSNPGVKYNLPAVRFGNISQLADAIHPIKQGNDIARPSHVFDMHSRPGYSGSPVFVYRTPGNDMMAIDEHGDFHIDHNASDNAFIKLLGIHSGQFLERMVTEKAEAHGPEPIVEGDKLVVQSSMTIVVPAWNISKLLDLQVFADLREMRERRLIQKGETKN